MKNKKLRAALVIVAAMAMLSGPGAHAERNKTTPTGWAWFASATTSELGQYMSDNNMRLIDLEVVSSVPLKFAASMVHNSGVHAKAWSWFPSLTFEQMTTHPALATDRVLDLESFWTPWGTRYAMITVNNQGADATGWWWVFDVTTTQITELINDTGGRIIDIERIGAGRYNAVLWHNSGQHTASWWWYPSVNTTQLGNLLGQNNARLVDLEPHNDGTYTAVTVQNTGQAWWWFAGTSIAEISKQVDQLGVRVVDLERYSLNGQTVWAAVLLDNLPALGRQLRSELIGPAQGQPFGFYLKRVGGPVITALNHKHKFEPASAIKAVHLLAAMRAVQANQISLTDDVTWYAHPNFPARYPGDMNYIVDGGLGDKDRCAYEWQGNAVVHNTSNGAYQDELGDVILRQMMERSDNRTTDAVWNRFGKAALDEAIAVAEMTNSSISHRIGCDNQNFVHNQLTAEDIAKLYEGVSDGTLLGTGALRDTFWELMWNGVNGWKEIVDEEAAKQGKSDIAGEFLSLMTRSEKGGGYGMPGSGCASGTDCVKLTSTYGGHITLPVKQSISIALPSGQVLNTPVTLTLQRKYVYGGFVDGTFGCMPVTGMNPACGSELSAIGQGLTTVKLEQLRGEIASALQTW